METNNEQNEIKSTSPLSTPSEESRSFAKPKGFRTKQLAVLAVAFKEPLNSAAMGVYLTGLADLTDEQVKTATERAVKELKFFPRVAELRDLAGASEHRKQDAEARRAWDEATLFAKKYVSNDAYGNYGPEHGWYPNTFPKLSDRILATVRRTGGWKAYCCMTDADFPFMQKRFFEEYAAWAAVEQVVLGNLLIERPKPQLVAKPMGLTKAEKLPKPPSGEVVVKKIPEPLTAAQIRDRREMLRQQAESVLKARCATQP